MPRVSIVLPFLGPLDRIERTLASVLAHKPADAEVLVVHADRYDDPFGLSGEVEFLHAPEARTKSELANRGAQRAAGSVLAIVAAPIEIDANWCEAALRHFETRELFSVSPAILDGRKRDRIASAGLEYRRSGYRGDYARGRAYDGSAFRSSTFVGPTLAAGFYRRSSFVRLGGFSPRWGDAAADLDLALRAAEQGWISALEPTCRGIAYGSLRSVSAVAEGRLVEEFFWQRQAATPSAWTRFRHRTLLAHECVTGFAAPRRWLNLMGRLTASKQLDVTSAATAETGAAKTDRRKSTTTIRIDGAHPTPGPTQPQSGRSRSERIRLAVRSAERRAA